MEQTKRLLEMLRRSVDEFNKWCRENPDALIDFSKVDLSGINLKGANFSNIKLSVADFMRANIAGANTRGAKMDIPPTEPSEHEGKQWDAPGLTPPARYRPDDDEE